MNSKPKRLQISQEQEETIKKDSNYSEVYVFSSSFLEEYKNQIIDFVSEEKKEKIRSKLDQITQFIIGDRIKAGYSALCCSDNAIHMDIKYANIHDDTFELKSEYDYIETTFVYELLHDASRTINSNGPNIDGITEVIINDHGNVIGHKNVGLNEGITQFLAENITGKYVSKDSYDFNKKVVSLLSDIVGIDTIVDSYFDNSDSLKNAINKLGQDENLYDSINSRLDTISKFKTTIKKIKNGTITPKNEDTLAHMETIFNAKKEELMEYIFANVILSKIQSIPLEQRNDELYKIVKKNSQILQSIEKYVPGILTNKNGIFIKQSDERIASIRSEISNYGINFEFIKNEVNKINKDSKPDEKAVDNFITEVDNFYEKNEASLEKERSTELTPLLKKELEGLVSNLDVLESVAQIDKEKGQVDAYKTFLKAYFRNIPDLDLEIEKIREERRIKKQIDQNKDNLIEIARESGRQAAISDVNKRQETPKEKPKDTPKDEVKEDSKEKLKEETRKIKPTLNDNFIVIDVTGEIIDQRNLSICDKSENIAKATGEIVSLEDEQLVNMCKTASNNYVDTLSNDSVQKLQQLYGEMWKEKIYNAFKEGYEQGMASQIKQSSSKGLNERKEMLKKIANNEELEIDSRAPSIEEIKFASENFDIVNAPDGTKEIVDKVTGIKVTSEKTKATVLFANEWIRAATPQLAFSEQGKQIYSFIQVQSKRDLEKTGSINLQELVANAEALGPDVSKVAVSLFNNENSIYNVDRYFRLQTPNAKEHNSQIEQPIEENAKSSSL